jgi:flagellar motor switch protein FliG
MTTARNYAPAADEDRGRVRQAAILVRAIGRDQAARTVSRLWPRDAQRLGGAMATLGRVSDRQVDAVVGAFLEAVGTTHQHGLGASDYLKRLLDGAGEPHQAVVDTPRPRRADGLAWMSTAAIVRLMRRQPPHLKAMTLAYLDSARAAEVVAGARPLERTEVLLELARLPGPARAQHDRSETHAPAMAQLGGCSGVAEILDRLEPGMRRQVLECIAVADPALAERLAEGRSPADDLRGAMA